ncbi:MAG: hypothetical protein ACI802_003660, partial [Candidatus Paceibacteria bacterium]
RMETLLDINYAEIHSKVEISTCSAIRPVTRWLRRCTVSVLGIYWHQQHVLPDSIRLQQQYAVRQLLRRPLRLLRIIRDWPRAAVLQRWRTQPRLSRRAPQSFRGITSWQPGWSRRRAPWPWRTSRTLTGRAQEHDTPWQLQPHKKGPML